MKLNVSLKEFKKKHNQKKNQVLFYKIKSKSSFEIENLINNFLVDKNSFIFESVEKGKIKGRYTIFGKEPDKIWEFNQKRVSSIISGRKKIIKGDPKIILSKIIDDFKFNIPSSLPPMCSMIAGYFSYDTIRYIEKIKNSCKNDLKLPDIRLIRPTTLIIHDNVKKEIFFVKNIFSDIKINNLEKKYFEIQDEINSLLISSRISKFQKNTLGIKFSVKSNISKKRFFQIVNKAKQYIKKGDIFQVVLSQRFETKLTKKPIEIYKKLRVTNPSPFMFFFNFNDFQIIGASP